MEEPVKNQPPPSSSSVGKSKLKYPLRSATKLTKDQNNKSPEFANNSSSNSKRGRSSYMSKSVSVLELSGKDKEKEKAAKPPRRQSIPGKSSVSPRQRTTAYNITPISEARLKRSINGQERCDTPMSDVSRSSVRRKFNILASASYWLSQIKLSESASKHSISLGFFKLGLEAKCEPLQRLREELKSYVQRHNLDEFGEIVKVLFESYEISETFEQLQESVTCSHVPEDATVVSGEDAQSTSSTAATKKFKPKSLNTDTQVSSAKASSKENVPRITSATKMRASVNLDPAKPKLVTESKGNNMKKKVQKSGKQEANNGQKIKKQDEKPVSEEVIVKALDVEQTFEGNKENMDAPAHMEEVSVIEAN